VLSTKLTVYYQILKKEVIIIKLYLLNIKKKEGGNKSVFGDLFNNLAKKVADNISNNLGSETTKKGDQFLIPENDLGLLCALKKAYSSEKDGK
jgi:hypothetical protein